MKLALSVSGRTDPLKLNPINIALMLYKFTVNANITMAVD